MAAHSGPSASNDFRYNALLLSGNGVNGAQNNTFLDSSTNNFTVTRTGNVAQGTFSPFSLAEGQWSNYFDGSGDYLTVPSNSAWNWTSSTFTLEMYVYNIENKGYKNRANVPIQVLNGSATADVANWSFGTNASGLAAFYYYGTSGATIVAGSTTVPLNTWTHLAVTYDGSSIIKVYVNGVLEVTATKSGTPDSGLQSLIIGAGNGTYYNGYVSNVRFVKGSVVYTTNFTPSTTPLTAITNTSLLTCQSNRFIDNSSNNFTITRNGDTKVTAFSPFEPGAPYIPSINGGSGYFDGSGDSISQTSGNFSASGNLTLEGWVYATNTNQISFSIGNESTNRMQFGLTGNGAFYYNIYGGAVINFGGVLPLNSWNHFAFVRSGTTVTAYLNGTSVGSKTISGTIGNANAIYIWGVSTGASTNIGYLSNVRYVNGTAVYTSNFTPPTAPLTPITNTSLLLNFTNAGIIDNAGKNDIETVGNVQISTSVKKYGTGSLAFDGSGDWLTLPITPQTTLKNENFTIEFWLYPKSLQDANPFTWGTNDTYYGTRIILTSAGTWSLLMSTTGTSHTVNSGLFGSYAANNWVHVALVRNGTNIVFYVNGVSAYSTTLSGALIDGLYNYIGALKHATIPFALNGYIDDLRITKGLARYTSNFDPPSYSLKLR